jgi:hypothetical protein
VPNPLPGKAVSLEGVMMFQGAVIREQGVTFAVVVVKKHVIDSNAEAGRAVAAFQPVFPGLPVVLTAQDFRGTLTYYGRPDIARFLASVPLSAIPWKQYTV